MSRIVTVLILILTGLASFGQEGTPEPDRQWPGYRGYFARGYLDGINLPLTWNVETSENIIWDIEVPGLALSSPVVWGDKVFITSAISKADTAGLRTGIYGDGEPVNDSSVHDWMVYCIDMKSGKKIWERKAYTGIPEVRRHPKATHANCTPATDGKHLVAFFASEGLYCYDMKGNLLWSKDFGKLDAGAFNAEWAEWEFASSPVIYGNRVIVQCDVRGRSFLAVYDADTGKEIWMKEREEYPTWSTPNIYSEGGKEYVVVNGYKHRGAYDLSTGEEVWKMSGGGDVPIPTPVVGEGMIYFNSAHGRYSPVLAVRSTSRGDITLAEGESSNDGVAWSIARGGSYMQTLLLYRGLLYNLNWNGQLSCYDPDTGEEYYREKLGKSDSFISSPVAADGYLYIIDDQGVVYTVEAGRNFSVSAVNSLGDICMTVPALAMNVILFRTAGRLIAVSAAGAAN